MYKNFTALPAGKQQRIRNAALRAFGRYGYKKTSAEQVAQSAGIAKGMVFHYFGSKQGLYEYLFEYTNECFVRWFGNLPEDLRGLDFIEQYRRATKIKLKGYTEDPAVFEFFTMLYTHPDNREVSERTKALFAQDVAMQMDAASLLENSDNTGLFKDTFDKEKAKKYVRWCIDGYTQQLMRTFSTRPLADVDLAPYWAECDDMLDDLKRLFYKMEQPEQEG